MKDLIGQGQGVESIEVGDESLRTFNRIAKKYGVDFAIKKEEQGFYKSIQKRKQSLKRLKL